MLIVFQILFVLFALSAVFGVFNKYRGGMLGPKGAMFWVVFWLAVIIAVVWPSSTAKVANIFGIGRGADFVTYISLAIMFYLLFKLHIKVESIGRDVTSVVRGKALEQKGKKIPKNLRPRGK